MPTYLTPKQIAKRLKSMSKGKEHLYCQFCQKQFRDNTTGFQTHQKSHQHIENVKEFLKEPQRYITAWSRQFEKLWNEIVTFRYVNREVRVSVLYDEFMKVEDHVRLQATKWKHLMSFVRDWARRNEKNVALTERAGAWWVKWTPSADGDDDNEDATKSRKRKRTELERQVSDIRRQVKAAKREQQESGIQNDESAQDEKPLSKPTWGGLDLQKSVAKKPTASEESVKSPSAVLQQSESNTLSPEAKSFSPPKTTSSEKSTPSTYLPGIIVRILNKKLSSGEYHRKKGRVLKILPGKQPGSHLIQVEMLASGDILQLPEKQAETIIPNLQRQVILLRGKHRGSVGTLVKLQKDQFSGVIELVNQGKKETVSVPYDDFSKKAS